MKQNYYIKAAIELGAVEDTYGYGLTEEGIINPDGSIQTITADIEAKATYYSRLEDARRIRDGLLKATDWVGFEDVPDSTLKQDLRAYRQQLRDITNQIVEGEDNELVWPVDPRVAVLVPAGANT